MKYLWRVGGNIELKPGGLTQFEIVGLYQNGESASKKQVRSNLSRFL